MNTTVSNFAPSNVRPFFFGSVLQNLEKEVLAAHIVTFLANNGDGWNIVIEAGKFLEHTRTQEFETLVYNNPLANPLLQQDFINAMYAMVQEGCVEWVEQLKTFKVTKKLIEFYTGYDNA